MRVQLKKIFAFVMMFAMLIGETIPAFAAEVSATASLSGGTYLLDESGNLIITEEENTNAVIEEVREEETLRENESVEYNVGILKENSVLGESNKENDSSEEVTETVEGTVTAIGDAEKALKAASVKETNKEAVIEDTLLECQSEEEAVFVLFVENQEPQYFLDLVSLKNYINEDDNRENTIYNIEIRKCYKLEPFYF